MSLIWLHRAIVCLRSINRDIIFNRYSQGSVLLQKPSFFIPDIGLQIEFGKLKCLANKKCIAFLLLSPTQMLNFLSDHLFVVNINMTISITDLTNLC